MSRMTKHGLCTYPDMVSGKIRMRDYFEMARMLDIEDYMDRAHARKRERRA